MLTPVKPRISVATAEEVAEMLAERYLRLLMMGAADELKRRQREDPKGKKGFSWPGHGWNDLVNTSQSILKDAVRLRAGIDDSMAGTHALVYDRYPELTERLWDEFVAGGGKFEEAAPC